jgi:bifunctional UDP-N-acetylglucosamine pyrophosphorylase/glucosamine-1-phosphate N-acetyltransferase
MGKSVGIVKVDDEHEVMGINDRVQLAEACQIINSQTLKNLMKAGVSIMDPQNTYISYDAKIGRDTVIYPNCFIGPNVIIGANCRIEGATSIKNSTIGDNVIIKYSYIDGADISNNVNIGPYSHIRPESVLAENVKVGNFSEIKKSVIETGSKVNHLSYIGDAKVGKNVNVGAGTITCNYDGSKKHQTIIGDNSFVGSNVNLVAPVKIGEQVLIAAGSTITDDVEDKKLVIARSKQLTKVRNS